MDKLEESLVDIIFGVAHYGNDTSSLKALSPDQALKEIYKAFKEAGYVKV